MLNAFSPGDTFTDRYVPAIRHQDSGQYLDRCALPRPIGSDVADKFTARNGKRHAVEREDSLVLRHEQRLDATRQARRTDSNAKRLGEIFDDDLRHGIVDTVGAVYDRPLSQNFRVEKSVDYR